MSSTHLFLLDQLLTQLKAEQAPEATDSEYWEFFTATQVLRDQRLDPEDIRSGVVGQESNPNASGTDGGIDSMYLLVNGSVIRDVDQAKSLTLQKGQQKGGTAFDVIIIQSRKTPGFAMDAILRIGNTCESIFAVDKDPATFVEKYSGALLNIVECFREAHKALMLQHPKVSVTVFYVSQGDTNSIHANVRGKAEELKEKLPAILPTIKSCDVIFLGAREVFAIYNKPSQTSFPLKCLNNMGDDMGGYVALVELSEYYKLIQEGGQIREFMFESNVRDYEGEVDVNKQISESLRDNEGGVNFWWLNNGITILSSLVTASHRELVIEDPRIVNGLQTSQEIFNTLSPSDADKRHVLIRIIKSPDAELQDRIIRATNSQTKIPPQYLRSSDDEQRNIEQWFRAQGYHYDRRKNSWRRLTVINFDRIIGMTELAQSAASMILEEPDHARARPSRYFKDHYKRLFGKKHPDIFFVCALLRKRTETFLRAAEADIKDRNNMLFHILTALKVLLEQKNSVGGGKGISSFKVEEIPDSTFQKALEIVRPIYLAHGASDKAAKGPEMAKALKADLEQYRQPKKVKASTKSPV